MQRTLLAGAASVLAASLAIGPASAFQEAPMLAEMVAAGGLPPVDERLPANPVVVPVVESIGQYGGVFSMHILGGTDRGYGWLEREIGYERLMCWAPEGGRAIPNIAESVDVNAESTTFTFHLREGLKWSDGELVTADDYEFFWNHIAINDDLSPSGPPPALTQNGEPATFEKIDDLTFSFTFEQPYGLFLQQLAAGFTGQQVSVPEHYARQFHIDFNPEAQAMAEAAGLASWTERFFQQVGGSYAPNGNIGRWFNPDLPVLHAWIVETPYDGSSSEVTARRNPYYFKVDPDGNQLPYADGVRIPIIADAEVLKLMTLNGQLDFVYEPQVMGVADKPVFFENQAAGDYRFIDLSADVSAAQVIHLNLEVTDPVKKKMYNDKDFRIALSVAIDRQEIIDILYAGLGEPWSLAVRRESPYFDEDMAKRHTEFDPEQSNRLLDGLGYTERDSEGYRLGPDGKRIVITVDVRTTNPLQADGLELILPRWKDIGIELRINSIDSALYKERQRANTFEAASNNGAGGLNETLNSRMYVPINENAIYGIPWAFWYLKDPRGIEPPEVVKHQLDLYDEFLATGDETRQRELFTEVLRIAKEEFRVIGINLIVGTYAIATNRMGNIPDSMIDSAVYPTPAPVNTATWYIKQ